MKTRTQLLAATAVLCLASMGCSCSPYAGMQYEGCGCGPGRWAPANGCGLTSCGCDDACAGGCDCGCHVQFLDGGRCECGGGLFGGRILDALCGCSGCSDELYWSEWHNDPPGCEPCDCCGNFTGPNCCGAGICNSPTCALGDPRESEPAEPEFEVEVAAYSGDMASAIDEAFNAYHAEFVETVEDPLQ